jgi:monoamine oxidase
MGDPRNERADVLIIGAGAAGLAAACALSITTRQAAQRKVVVLEARGRIGGRVFTHRDPDAPIPIELGAEFVHGKSLALWHLAERAHLKLQQTSERHWYFEKGKVSKSVEFWRKIERLNDEMRSRDVDQSFKEFLSSLPNDEETQRAKAKAVLYVEGFHAAQTERIGIRGIVKANEAAQAIDGGKMFRFLDGYDSLMKALWAEAESFGAQLHLNTLVKEIRWDNKSVKAVCEGANGDTSFSASCAIFTLPLAVLQASAGPTGIVRFLPDLPEAKRRAISQLATGNVLRIVLRFRERFWEGLKLWDEDARVMTLADAGFIHYPEAPIPTWWTQLPVRAPVLVGWAGGPKADALSEPPAVAGGQVSEPRYASHPHPASPSGRGDWQFSTAQPILDEALSSLSLIFNISIDTIRDQLEASYFHDWRDDPFSLGAYSYVPVNGLEAQQILSQPIGDRLFFAGEATSVGHIGTVHGALESGQRAAQEILKSGSLEYKL